MNSLDIIRLSLPIYGNSKQGLERSIKNANAQLEHQQMRLVNADMLENAENAWLLENRLLGSQISEQKKMMASIEAEIVHVNKKRKKDQSEFQERENDMMELKEKLHKSIKGATVAKEGFKREIQRLKSE